MSFLKIIFGKRRKLCVNVGVVPPHTLVQSTAAGLKPPTAECAIPPEPEYLGFKISLTQAEWDELCHAAKAEYERRWPRCAETFPFYYVLKCLHDPDHVWKIVDCSLLRAIADKDPKRLAEEVEEWTSCYG